MPPSTPTRQSRLPPRPIAAIAEELERLLEDPVIADPRRGPRWFAIPHPDQTHTLVFKRASYVYRGTRVVANVRVDGVLIRHADWLHRRDDGHQPLVRYQTVATGTVALFAVRATEKVPLLVHLFSHWESGTPIDERDSYAEWRGRRLCRLEFDVYMELARDRNLSMSAFE